MLFVAESTTARERLADFFETDAIVLPQLAASAETALETVETSLVDCVVSDGVRTTTGEPILAAARAVREQLATVLYTPGSPEAEQTATADVVLHYDDEPDPEAVRRAIYEATGVDALDEREGWRLLGRFDWERTGSVGTAVVEALAAATDRDVLAMAPLYDSVDPDALDGIVTHSPGTGSPVVVEFDLDGTLLSVSAAGPVWYRPMGRGERHPS